MKNTLIKIGLGLLILSAILWVVQRREEKLPSLEPKAGENQYFVRSIPDIKKRGRPLDSKEKAYEKSLHEGTAVFVGPYRMELAVQQTDKEVIWAIFLDNYLAQPVLPNRTEIVLTVDNKKMSLIGIKNGFLAASGPKPVFPQKVTVSGKINNNPFSTTMTVESFRKKSLSPNQGDL